MHALRNLQRDTLRQIFFSHSTPIRPANRSFVSTSQQPFRTRPTSRTLSSRLLRRSPVPRRFQSTQTSEASLSLSQRLRKLSREYGWSAVGVYFALSALDFPFCFLAVNQLGTERIGRWEHIVISNVTKLIQWPLGEAGKEDVQNIADKVEDGMEVNGVAVPVGGKAVGVTATAEPGLAGEGYAEVIDHGYHEAEKANRGEKASLWTQLALAYAIHKSFIFLRVPLTAAVTPKVVRVLRGWGWDIGKRRGKIIAAEGAKGTGVASAKGTGINTGGK